MNGEQQQNSDNNNDQPIISKDSSSETNNSATVTAQPIPSSTENVKDTGHELPQIVVNVFQKVERKGLDYPTIFIGIFGLLINGFLAYYTYQLFEQTVRQTQNSLEAVSEAKRANDLTERSFDSAQVESKRTYNLNKDAFEIQTKSTREAAMLFELENLPQLQIQDFSFNPNAWKGDTKINFTYYLKNLGNHPVKLRYSKTGFTIDFVLRNKELFVKALRTNPTTIYI